MQMGAMWVGDRCEATEGRSERSGFVQQLLEVPHPVNDGDDLERTGFRTIDDYEFGITRHGPETDRFRCDFSAFCPKQGKLSQTGAGR